ncbi:leishmanolysin-related zinc metalloendopeptidase [Alteromonas sp. 14N.309.X.WAT.G.H12]|uniref:leishmanolysin-related zinc metalloendopeptidase n=1 Tax=Alteromonas sp. 14N.309.X.WAT.G.H12 TaxID=3120824 RepID=UPI002FD122A6
MKKIITSMAMLAATSAHAELPEFDITIVFDEGLTESQEAIFLEAEAYWESLITNYAYDVTFPTGLTITASGEDIDGVSGVLGSASPTLGYSYAGITYASTGTMTFDTADLADMEEDGSLYYVILHEMAHVIGYGTLWTYNDLYDEGTGQYTGEYALAEYQAEFDSTATYIPVEQDGGTGTADGHWDEDWAGGTEELMTGWYEGSAFISNTTLAQFMDLGYIVDFDSLVAVVPAPTVGAATLLMFVLYRQQKSKVNTEKGIVTC